MSDIKEFREYIDAERARLESTQAELLQDRRLIDERLSNIFDELRAIEAYEAAKAGKSNGAKIIAGLREAISSAQRARRGSRREELLQLIGQNDGLTRGEILERMGLKGDKSGEVSVSNALVKLKKQGVLRHEGGKYYVLDAQEGLRQAAE